MDLTVALMPRKFASLEDIYARTVRLAEVNLSAAPQSPTISASHAISEGTGPLSIIFQDDNCPTLSPRGGYQTPQPPTITIADSPSLSSESGMSDIGAELSESTSRRVDELQGLIEEAVSRIVKSSDLGTLIEDAPHVLGQWVHCEEEDLGALQSILADLIEKGSASSDFQVVNELLGAQYLVTPNSPLEQFAILPLIPMKIGNLYFSFTNSSLFMLLTLSLVRFILLLKTEAVPNALQSLVELIYDFVLNLVNEQIGGLSGNVKQKATNLHLGHFYFGNLGPLFIVLALTGLELGVAILQAYVFTILICIYLNDATNLH